ncbi:MAG: beta-ketoadipyl CoA thiolase [Elusimicrobia bacterium GWC2_65_9]|nr:MAG: beta-ketoadipyl CoA thiolase [Elusimicrobia bacterium GWA2_66_18]OGR71953.1 MAG: beta-ketoadipyl CoA thiolase [Elusimicrobia bacterium GWC2_65_9]
MASREAVVVAAVRTPVGRLGGGLSSVRPDDLAAHAISSLLKKVPGLDPKEISDVYFGCANQAGEDNRNVARIALLLAGLPQSVPGCTVNRLCASGLEAINASARAVLAGEGDIYIAGGVESMSRAPYSLPKAEAGYSFGNLTAYDTALGWRYPNRRLAAMFPLEGMGETAENVAERWKISRADQDAFALQSHSRAALARDSVFADEIISVPIFQKKGTPLDFYVDETIRPDTTLEKLSILKPAFREGGTVTAGNSSTLNDGSSAVLVMEAKKAFSLGLKPFARWAGSAAAGVDPRFMGMGPAPATQKLLGRLGWKASDLDLVEINEAFAAQSLACQRELGLDQGRLNVNGGGISLGHPLGSSGCRIVVTLLHEMRRRKAKKGLAALCIGVGQGLAAAWEGV